MLLYLQDLQVLHLCLILRREEEEKQKENAAENINCEQKEENYIKKLAENIAENIAENHIKKENPEKDNIISIYTYEKRYISIII